MMIHPFGRIPVERRGLEYPDNFHDTITIDGEEIGIYPAMCEDVEPVNTIHPLVYLLDQNKPIQAVLIQEFIPNLFINLDVTVDGKMYGVAVWWVGEYFQEKVMDMSMREVQDLLLDDYRASAIIHELHC